jgi:hypothetical protein
MHAGLKVYSPLSEIRKSLSGESDTSLASAAGRKTVPMCLNYCMISLCEEPGLPCWRLRPTDDKPLFKDGYTNFDVSIQRCRLDKAPKFCPHAHARLRVKRWDAPEHF